MPDSSIYRKLRDSLEPIGTKGVVLISGLPPYLYSYGASLLATLYQQRVIIHSFESREELENFTEQKSSISYESVELIVGAELGLAEILLDYDYARVSRVWEPGEFSLFGDVVIFWPKGNNSPLRVSLLDEEIEEISVLDPATRKAVEKLERFELLNNDDLESGFEVIVGEPMAKVRDRIDQDPLKFLVVKGMSSLEAEEIGLPVLDFGFRSLPIREIYKNNEDAILQIVQKYISDGYSLSLIVNKRSDLEKVPSKLMDLSKHLLSRDMPFQIPKGYISTLEKVLYVSSFELFGSIEMHKFLGASGAKRKKINSSDEFLRNLLPGDFVVHEDHGIGEYVGIVERNGDLFVLIKYAGKDKLYVPLDQLEKITRYVGTGKAIPRLTTLNSGAWRRIKRRVEEDAEKLAKELLRIYALRKMKQGTGIAIDTSANSRIEKFIAKFPFTDTDDQIAATEEIMNDLYSGIPMDRLIVGDVGFGKTEVAMRAIFAVADAGYQVAFLAPTTILVEQHRAVLSERFKGSGLRIAALSRFLSKPEVKDILRKLEKGDIDIVVGTHALLGDSVKFKDLGLVVIDEEQKFGVKHKEKLKSRRVDVHVLSLSATPIPRTLNMALSGIRDISIISTPPAGRKPIRNKFMKFDWEQVTKAVQKEFDRGGQVYFLHNKVRTMEEISAKLKVKIGKQARISIAHGQMDDALLGMVMKEFAMGESNLLVCSTIIENGIDLPNVNTLIVNDAENFGLSQLYQIRGRIGRSSRSAFAYFMYRNLRGNSGDRLSALSESEELGSGLLLSNRDLEIRGAGNVLGREQSGSIDTVGYGLFMKLLEDKVEELRSL